MTCACSGEYVRCPCTSCSTAATCVTAWTMFPTTSTITVRPPPPPPRRRNSARYTGFVALAAARAAAGGADLATVAESAAAAVARNHGFIVVQKLDNLRRSGRIGGAGAWLGTKLSLKPLLRIDDGKLVLAQRVRTASKAVATMIDRVCEVVGEHSAAIAVHHVANPDGAADLVAALAERLPAAKPTVVTDLGPVLALHVGAGALAVCVEVDAPD